MKVHPAPRKRSNAAFQFSTSPPLEDTPHSSHSGFAFGGGGGGSAAAGGTIFGMSFFTRSSSSPPDDPCQKRLRRLPHIFSKVLELPLPAEADVDIRDGGDAFLFTVAVDPEGAAALPATVRARAVDICEGVTKVVIRDGAEEDEEGPDGGRIRDSLLMDDLELDRWRFRLPEAARPELASAAYVDGDLVVSIPKAGGGPRRGNGGQLDEGEEAGEDDDGVRDAGIGRLVVVQ